MEEIVINEVDKIYMWQHEYPQFSFDDAFVGRLLLTNERFIFLSSGESGAREFRENVLVGGIVLASLVGTSLTEGMDLSALNNRGSLNIPLREIVSFDIKRKFGNAYFVIRVESFMGDKYVFSFRTGMAFSKKWMLKFQEDFYEMKDRFGR